MTVARGTQLLWDAKIGMAEFVKRCADPAYRAKAHTTKIYQGVEEIRRVEPTPAPPHPPPSSGLAQQIQKVIYCAQNPLAALAGPRDMKPALTADPGYASFNTPSVVAQLKAHFGTCGAWFVQTQVPAAHARDFVDSLGLDFLIFQGETQDEFSTAMGLQAKLLVGNANAWLPAQRVEATALINAGKLAFAQEAYTNLGGPWPEATSSGGVPAASLVLGVYDGSGEVAGGWYPTVRDYRLHTPVSAWSSVSLYHADGLRPTDWSAL